ncbi:MAG: glycosyltransferase [Ardenticatenales bacterium]|nr:glycosyltransferase [Ardenticatenales bacterium]
MTGQKIAYVMSRFPHLPETFILREMNDLERQGWEVALYPLILQEQPVVHAAAKPWLARRRQAPFVSREVAVANARAVGTHPLRYGKLLGRAIWENRSSPNFLVRSLALFPKATYMARQMQEEGVAHIHAHYATHPALAAWLIHHLTGISYSVTVHAHDIFVHTEMLATKLRDASFIAAISEYNREYLARVVGPWVREKIHIVHCGIEPSDYPVRAPLADWGKCFEIITTGSLQPYKGQSYLIEACERLREQGVPFRCRIIGEGEERPELERRIAAAQLGAQVELMGAQSQEAVARLLASAHCYVQPSIITPSGKMEGIPVSLMEALASLLPTIATAISGIPELVRDGETGLLVPPADAVALAGALSTIYREPERAQRMAQAGRGLVLREFELKHNVQKLSSLFEQHLQKQSAPPPRERLRAEDIAIS